MSKGSSSKGSDGLGGESDLGEDPRADLAYGSVPRLVDSAAGRFGDAPALVEGGRVISFAGLRDAVRRTAGAALAAGVEHGERVGIWAPNSARWVVAALGVLSAGGVLVPVNTRLKGPEAADILRRSGVRLLFGVSGFLGVDYEKMIAAEQVPSLSRFVALDSEESWGGFLSGAGWVSPDRVEARAGAVTPEDLSDIVFTSGTTGSPKGVMATHAQTLRAFGSWASIAGLRRGDRYLVVNPFFHTFGLKAGILASLMAGAAVIPVATFDVRAVLELVASQGISVLPGPPTIYQSILDLEDRAGYDLTTLRLGVTGAAVVPVELIERMSSELGFDTVLTAYGLTESTGMVTMCRRGDPPGIVASTSGRAIPGVEVKVAGPSGSGLPPGQPGEVLVRGYSVTQGYLDDPAATEAAIDRSGWLHTGDVGVLDESGYLRITDRIKDMYVVGGFNVYPAEIEQVLARHEAVKEVAVVGMPDRRLGEVGVAFVVADSPVAGEKLSRELTEMARSQLANFKVPRRVELVEELPRNASGKVLKQLLRDSIPAAHTDSEVPREPLASAVGSEPGRSTDRRAR